VSTEVYLNPNWEPNASYGKIKSSCLIYDRVLVWCPNQDFLEKAGFDTSDFLRLCLGTGDDLPAILPVFRDSWRDYDNIAKTSPKRLRPDRLFHSKIVSIAETHSNQRRLILPSSLYQTGYQLTNEAYSVVADKSDIQTIAKSFDPNFVDEIREVCDREQREFGWGVLNAYAQDLLAFGQVGANSPLATRDSLEGYKFFTEKGIVRNPRVVDSAPTLDTSQSDFWLSNIVDIEAMTVPDIFEFRRLILPELKRFATDIDGSKILSLDDKKFEERLKLAVEGNIRSADGFVQAAGFSQIVVLIATSLGLGAASLNALLAMGPIAILILFAMLSKHRARLTLGVAKLLNFRHPGNQLLLKSTYVTDAMFKFTGGNR